ncbi:MAG: hypothetical protein ACI8XX_001581 [Polaribacter sp.]
MIYKAEPFAPFGTIYIAVHAGDPDDMRARVADYRSKGYRDHSFKVGASESIARAA